VEEVPHRTQAQALVLTHRQDQASISEFVVRVYEAEATSSISTCPPKTLFSQAIKASISKGTLPEVPSPAPVPVLVPGVVVAVGGVEIPGAADVTNVGVGAVPDPLCASFDQPAPQGP
jgi:hypothetical protein